MGLRDSWEGRSRLRQTWVPEPGLLHTVDSGVAASSLSLIDR